MAEGSPNNGQNGDPAQSTADQIREIGEAISGDFVTGLSAEMQRQEDLAATVGHEQRQYGDVTTDVATYEGIPRRIIPANMDIGPILYGHAQPEIADIHDLTEKPPSDSGRMIINMAREPASSAVDRQVIIQDGVAYIVDDTPGSNGSAQKAIRARRDFSDDRSEISPFTLGTRNSLKILGTDEHDQLIPTKIGGKLVSVHIEKPSTEASTTQTTATPPEAPDLPPPPPSTPEVQRNREQLTLAPGSALEPKKRSYLGEAIFYNPRISELTEAVKVGSATTEDEQQLAELTAELQRIKDSTNSTGETRAEWLNEDYVIGNDVMIAALDGAGAHGREKEPRAARYASRAAGAKLAEFFETPESRQFDGAGEVGKKVKEAVQEINQAVIESGDGITACAAIINITVGGKEMGIAFNVGDGNAFIRTPDGTFRKLMKEESLSGPGNNHYLTNALGKDVLNTLQPSILIDYDRYPEGTIFGVMSDGTIDTEDGNSVRNNAALESRYNDELDRALADPATTPDDIARILTGDANSPDKNDDRSAAVWIKQKKAAHEAQPAPADPANGSEKLGGVAIGSSEQVQQAAAAQPPNPESKEAQTVPGGIARLEAALDRLAERHGYEKPRYSPDAPAGYDRLPNGLFRRQDVAGMTAAEEFGLEKSSVQKPDDPDTHYVITGPVMLAPNPSSGKLEEMIVATSEDGSEVVHVPLSPVLAEKRKYEQEKRLSSSVQEAPTDAPAAQRATESTSDTVVPAADLTPYRGGGRRQPAEHSQQPDVSQLNPEQRRVLMHQIREGLNSTEADVIDGRTREEWEELYRQLDSSENSEQPRTVPSTAQPAQRTQN